MRSARTFTALLAAACLSALAIPPTALAGTPADLAGTSQTDVAAAPVTVPALSSWTPADGSYALGKRSKVLLDEGSAAVDEARTFSDDLAAQSGVRPPVVQTKRQGDPGDIRITLDPSRTDLGAEGYALTVGPVTRIVARTDAGAFYGTRTVLQLLRAGTTVTAGSTVDVPQYAERGVGVCACIINVSVPWFERLIKDAAYLKLNQLWIEFKIKSTAQPEANEWGYYTRAQVAQLQRLADQYHVTIVPEVNSPGHIEPWIRNRPDLQLTDSAGAKQVSRLDITKPEAFSFLTSIIDEYFETLHTPYWHMGADEYMLGSDYAKYPQILAYAREKFGASAVPEDAFIDFINRVNAYVKAKGKTLRMWNDGITTRATVPLDKDIVIEHWIGSGVKPAQLLADGRKVENAAYALYNVRGGSKMNTRGLYDQGWTPLRFDGQTVADRNGITGAKITLWPDNGSGNTENEIESEIRLPLRFVAQSTWGLSTPDPTYDAFVARADAAGRAPGFDNENRTPVADGTYSLARGNKFLGTALADDGAAIGLGAETAWDVKATADGYYTLRELGSGRCAETRLGTRYLNTPLEPGTAITTQTCDPANRLQRWQLARSGDGITLTNAITRMVAVLDGAGGLRQQVPDTSRATVFALDRAVRTTATLDKATVSPGSPATLTVSVENTTTRSLRDVTVTPSVPAGWTVAPGNGSAVSVAAGASWSASFAVTPPASVPAGTASVGARVSYRSNVQHSVAVTAGVRVSCAEVATTPAAVTYVDSEETAGEDGRAVNAIDGNPATFWHTEWSASEPRPPHEIQLDLGAQRSVCAVTYLPRQNASNGRFGDYEIYLSTDGTTWGQPVAKGTFANTPEAKWVPFATTSARYLRLVELTEVAGSPWGTAAEITADAS